MILTPTCYLGQGPALTDEVSVNHYVYVCTELDIFMYLVPWWKG